MRDFGPGIPADERPLCRRLARQMGGDLRLESASPGAAFVLTLPAS